MAHTRSPLPTFNQFLDQTITFGVLPTKYMGDGDFDPGATATSYLPVTYASDNPAVATIVANKVHLVGAGTANIIASQPGNWKWNPAPDVIQPQVVTVHQWFEVQPAGDANKSWSVAGSDASGNVLLQGIQGGRLYLSTDNGVTWPEIRPIGDVDAGWRVAAVSGTGQYIVAGVTYGRLWRSANGGSGWSEIQPAGDVDIWWGSVGISNSGQYMIVGGLPSRVYTSNNYGQAGSWTERRPGGNDMDLDWYQADVSSTGQYMVITCPSLDGLYISPDYGWHWDKKIDGSFYGACISDNGQVIVAGKLNGLVYLSTNGGTSWTETKPTGSSTNGYWQLYCDSDGSHLIAASGNGLIGKVFTSSNGGTSWSEVVLAAGGTSRYACAINDTGSAMIAGVQNKRTYMYR